MRNFQSTLKLLFLTAILGFSFPNMYKGEDLNELIKRFCLQGFKQELTNSNKSIDLEIGEYTCDCFVTLINNNQSFDSARERCKEDALKKYSSKTIL